MTRERSYLNERLVIRTYDIPYRKQKIFFKSDRINELSQSGIYKYNLQLITNEHEKRIRNIMYKYALYFKREFGYDFVQYSLIKEEDIDKCISFLFMEGETSIGGCIFRNRVDGSGYKDYEGWCLQWIWLHPYFRNKGIFTKTFPFFQKLFGNFFIEPPLSKTMSHIVNKIYGSYKEMLDKTKNK